MWSSSCPTACSGMVRSPSPSRGRRPPRRSARRTPRRTPWRGPARARPGRTPGRRSRPRRLPAAESISRTVRQTSSACQARSTSEDVGGENGSVPVQGTGPTTENSKGTAPGAPPACISSPSRAERRAASRRQCSMSTASARREQHDRPTWSGRSQWARSRAGAGGRGAPGRGEDQHAEEERDPDPSGRSAREVRGAQLTRYGIPRRRAIEAASRSAARMLRSLARPVPARSQATPWSGLVRTKGRPSVTLTAGVAQHRVEQLHRDEPLVVVERHHRVELAERGAEEDAVGRERAAGVHAAARAGAPPPGPRRAPPRRRRRPPRRRAGSARPRRCAAAPSRGRGAGPPQVTAATAAMRGRGEPADRLAEGEVVRDQRHPEPPPGQHHHRT